jgi:hypothetical protein
VDRSRHTYSALGELRQIQIDARQSTSIEILRQYFERIQNLRRTHIDDFDIQLLIAEVQEEIIDRARAVRDVSSAYVSEPSQAKSVPQPDDSNEKSEAAEIPPDVPRLDTKNWRRAVYLALFFTIVICAGFFYLIQTARRINFPATDNTGQPSPSLGSNKNAPVKNASNAPPQTPQIIMRPAVRLYTDLIPGTVSIDDAAPQDLKDGELILDNLPPGRHSIKVTGRSANAGFSFDVEQKAAPKIAGLPSASNAMAVLISEENGKGRVVTNGGNSELLIDGKSAGQVGTGGLNLSNLGTVDHDLQVTEGKDRQRFVLTYTKAPVLTAYVKSDPNAGTLVIVTGQDGTDVFINDSPYRRKTDRGQIRVPLRVGDYTVRVHKAGFLDPPAQTVSIKKAEETALQFRMEALPQLATLEVKNAVPGTMVYVDDALAASIGNDGTANISNVQAGDHTIELKRDQALPKKFERTFRTGDLVVLSGPEVELQKVMTNNAVPPASGAVELANQNSTKAENYGMELEGEQVRKGGGFVPYHTPKISGHYSFQAQGRIGGLLKHSKLQWYAGYQDAENYVLYILDGKHAIVREFRDGKSREVNRIPFIADSTQWVQVYLSVTPNSIDARIKTPDSDWSNLGIVSDTGRDFTQDKVGFYIPANDEIAVANFRFSNH